MYYTTTRDFKTFAPTKLFFDPGLQRDRLRDRAATASRLRARAQGEHAADANLRVAFGDSPLGPWRDVSKPFTENFTEGPTVAQDRRRLADLLRRLSHSRSTARPRRATSRRLPTSRKKSRSPRATSTARCSSCRGATSNTCKRSARSRCPSTRLPLVSKLSAGGDCQAACRDRRRRQPRPLPAELGIARPLPDAAMVPRRQVRHLHPLGRVLRARVRQRVVSAQHVPRGHARVQASRRHLRPASTSSATRISSRSSRPRSSTPRVGQAVQGSRREVRDPRRRASRRLPDVRQRR